MDKKSLVLFIALCIVSILITIFIKYSLNKFNRDFSTKIDENEERIKELYGYSYDLYLENPPANIVIDNPYNCTPEDLRVCDVNDPFSCQGCKSLISSCVHIEKDTRYINHEGVESIVPANASEDEGYCLTRRNTTQSCNPYHGDLVLIQTDPGSFESMLYCECKNPGYIGKTRINGACDEVFVCDGKIADINKPLDEIQCICQADLMAKNINGVPTCIAAKVKEYIGFDDEGFYDGIVTIPKDHFNSTIASTLSGFPGSNIINPCKYCMITGKYIANGTIVETEDGGWQCAVADSHKNGLPLRRNFDSRLLKGEKGPDGIIDVTMDMLYIHGYVYENEFEQMTARLLTSKNKEFLEYVGADLSKKYTFINLKDHQLVFPGSFGSVAVINAPGIACSGIQVPLTWTDDFIYSCKFVQHVPSDRKPKGHNSYMNKYMRGNYWFMEDPVCPPKHHALITSGTFKKWKEYEAYNSAHYEELVNGMVKFEIKQKFKESYNIKYLFSVYDLSNSTSTHYGTESRDLYNEWFETLIPKEEE